MASCVLGFKIPVLCIQDHNEKWIYCWSQIFETFFSGMFLIASIPNIAYTHIWYVFLNKALITENYLAMRYKVTLEHA